LIFFGQYGQISKLSISKQPQQKDKGPSDQQPPNAAYISYSSDAEAAECIRCVDGCWLDGRLVRAFVGTLKYCSQFVKGINCTNPDCFYLHEFDVNHERYTSEELPKRPLSFVRPRPRGAVPFKSLRLPSLSEVTFLESIPSGGRRSCRSYQFGSCVYQHNFSQCRYVHTFAVCALCGTAGHLAPQCEERQRGPF